MGDLALNIAVSGVDAQQTAMDTVAQNLANANTPGYLSETADIVSTTSGDALGVGAGAHIATVSQTSDGLLMANAQQTQGALAYSTALQQVLSGAQAVFPEPSNNGIASQLANFWQSWDAIAQNPSGTAARTQVIDQAQNLATQFNLASSQLTNLSNDAYGQLKTLTTETNTELAQVASLNEQIVATKQSGTPPNSLVDQRNQVLDQLASNIGAVASPQADGSVNVVVGGITLVQGTWADTLQTQYAAATSTTPASYSLQAVASGASLPASSGTAAGLLAAMNSYIPTYQNQLDTTAYRLGTDVNTYLAAGYTATGSPGAPLFTGVGSSTAAAVNIGVNPAIVADPQLIAASAVAGSSTSPNPAANDGANAQAIAAIADWTGGQPPPEPAGSLLAQLVSAPYNSYSTLIEDLGNNVQAINTQVQAQTSVANAAKQNLQAATGVDPNAQMVALLTYQQAYQASAKVIATAASAMQALLQAV